MQLVTPFLSRAPELLAWFKDFLGHNDQAASQQYEPIQSVSKQEKLSEEQVLEIGMLIFFFSHATYRKELSTYT